MGIDYIPSTGPGVWRQDPISQVPLALGAHWGEVAPFVIESGAVPRAPAARARQRGYARRLTR